MSYYVYELVDPRCGSVFYVGKGKKGRRFQHERDAVRGVAGGKCDRIREILDAGLRVRNEIVETFEDEAEAYAAEAARITRYGLECLANLTPGGGGGFSAPIDPVKAARKTVDRFRKQMRVSLELARAGYRLMLGPYDLTECCIAVAESTRKQAGEDYFDQRVWKELSCQLA